MSKTWTGIEKKNDVNVLPCHTLRKNLVSWPLSKRK